MKGGGLTFWHFDSNGSGNDTLQQSIAGRLVHEHRLAVPLGRLVALLRILGGADTLVGVVLGEFARTSVVLGVLGLIVRVGGRGFGLFPLVLVLLQEVLFGSHSFVLGERNSIN